MPSLWKHANEGDSTAGQRESKQRIKDVMKVTRRRSKEGKASQAECVLCVMHFSDITSGIISRGPRTITPEYNPLELGKT